MRRLLIISLALVLAVTGQVLEDDDNEVSEDKDPILNYGVLSQPFRMQKMNLMWEKARKNLQENKLKLLYSELKMQVPHRHTAFTVSREEFLICFIYFSKRIWFGRGFMSKIIHLFLKLIFF